MLLSIVLKFKVIWTFDLLILIFNFLVFDKIDIMLFETLRSIESFFSFSTYWFCSIVIFLVLHCGNFVMSNEFWILFFTYCEIMIVKSSFIGNLLWNELSVMSSRNTLIYKFLLIWSDHQVSIYELGHFYVVCEDVKWQILSLSNGNEFVFWPILLIWSINHSVFVVSISTLLESCNGGKNLSQNFITGHLFVSETTVLPVEKFSKSKSMRYRSIFRKLMKQKGIDMIMKQFNLGIFVFPWLHVVQDIIRNSHLRHENLGTFAHHEHWEVVAVFIVRLHVSKNGCERFLILLINNGLHTIARAVDTIDLIKHVYDVITRVKIWNRHNSDTRLL